MDKVEIRAVIKYLVKKGLTVTAIKTDMDDVLGQESPSLQTVNKWALMFKRGRQGCEDDPRSGRPSTSVTPEIVKKIQDIVLADRRVKVRQVAEATGISIERAHHVITNVLNMNKVSARWVPRLLSVEQKRVRKDISIQCLGLFKKDPKDFMRRFVTMDETWVHHYTPETKQQSMQWKHVGSPTPKKAKTVPSAGKVMASIFWDAKGIILIDYLQTGTTINAQYYCTLLEKLKTKIAEKRPQMKRKKFLFHHDNAPCHTAKFTTEKLAKLHFQLVPHPPYSPDLAPSDFFLFPNLKKFLAGKKFQSNEEVMNEVNTYFEDLDESVYKNGLNALEYRWNKCIELAGEYVEK